jgi:DNA invertase Pin-like site-specific DNA recombinase
MEIGYARVSTIGQNLDRQVDALTEYGVKKENIFCDKMSGKNLERPELKKLLQYAREGDQIIVAELTRISRSTKDLIALIELLASRKIDIKSIKESWLDTTTAQGKLMLTIMAGLSQFEHDLISERTKEGLKSARMRGRIGGRPKTNNKSIQIALKMHQSNQHTIAEICEACKISRATLYNYLKDNKNNNI